MQDHADHDGHAGRSDHAALGLMKDPVCGMAVDPATAPHRTRHEGVTHVFCSAGCQAKFEADPARYLAAAPVHGDAHGHSHHGGGGGPAPSLPT
jgi:Cu+-exporting ATPase